VGQVAELMRRASEQIQPIEIVTAKELAAKLKLPVSWVQEACRTRCEDPIPCLVFGKYKRFRWGSAELNSWLARRMNGKA
jgi:hypothetical protein